VNVESPGGRRPGRPPSLSRDDVARAALDEGVVNLSMPAVAKRLGVGHSTLYRYVHDRDDLLLAALDLALREFEWPPVDLGWRELLTEFADAMWRFFGRYPGMAEVSQVVPGMPPRALDIATAYVERLRAVGLSARDATVAVDFVADVTVAAEIGHRRMSRVFDTPRGRRSLRDIYLEPPPGMAEAAALDSRDSLDDKLAMLLDGLATRLGEPTSPASVAEPEPASEARSDRDAIAAAGRLIGRRAGLAAVSVRAVAEELGATVTAVRREVGDRDGVVVAMLDAVASDIVMPDPVDDPRADLVALATALRAVLLVDPWAVPALATDGLAGPLILPLVRRVFDAFRAAGVPAEEVASAGRVLWEHLYGAVLGQGRSNTFARQLVRSSDLGAEPVSADRSALGIEIVVDGLLDRLR
jgi:AcrR family transcriptional regulator